MESFLSRNRNLIVLLAALLLQVIGLAVQVRKPAAGATNVPGGPAVHVSQDGKGVRLIRFWAESLVTPYERVTHGAGQWFNGVWNEYVDLRHTREQNKELQKTVDRLRLEQAELREDALQGQRLQGLVKFREGYIYDTVAAQVIGTSGSLQSHVIWLDKGSDDGLRPDMAVITTDGIVGKVRDVFPGTAQVLMINDQTSGAGVVLETTRIRGILRGNAFGQPQVINILADARIQPGEPVLTAGGDQIFPRGLPVGAVERVDRDKEKSGFIDVVVKPAANLQHLDEVLVITSLQPHLSAQQMADLATSEEMKGAEVAAEAERKRAAAEMAERLPGLKDPNAPQVPVDPNNPGAAPVPVAPKPLPAAHPDRFSPGAAGGEVGPETTVPAATVPAATVPAATAAGANAGSSASPKAKTQPNSGTESRPAKAKAAPKAPQFAGRTP